MLTFVIYDTKFGNTEKIAESIARGAGTLGRVRVMDTIEAAGPFEERPDLLFVGGPTQRRGRVLHCVTLSMRCRQTFGMSLSRYSTRATAARR